MSRHSLSLTVVSKASHELCSMYILMVVYTSYLTLASGYGSYIGHTFAGVLSNADDVVLLPMPC